MNPAHKSLYEALAEAAGSGSGLGPDWEERLDNDPKLRSIADRFERISAVLTEQPQVSAPQALEGRVVSTLQAGHREDRVVESLRALKPQEAPPELEALVADALPGATQLEAPPELDERIDALLRDWEGEGEVAEERPRFTLRKVFPIGLAAAASLLFVVVLAMPRKSAHERARDEFVRSVIVVPMDSTTEGMSPLGKELLDGVTGGLSEHASKRGRTTNAPKPRINRRVPLGPGGRATGPSSRGGAGAQSGSQNSNSAGTGAAGRNGADILTKLSDSYTPPHEGDREVRLSQGLESPIVLIYQEHVSVAEDGTFAIDPLMVSQPQMAPSAEDLFLLLQKTREAFVYRYRGFQIQDLSLFTQQYTMAQSFNSSIISGKECVELDVQRADGTGYSYHLWVEPETGICLRTQEFDPDGALVTEVEYTSLNLTPSFVGALSGGPSLWASIDTNATPARVFPPLWIPEGYVHVSTETRSDAQGGEWVRLRYTDGLETLFVLQGERQTGGVTPPRGASPNALTRVAVHEVGSWTVAEGDAGDVHLVVLGKCPEADLVATLASTAP